MVIIIKRRRRNKTYYYLRHNDGKIQYEIYVGKTLPKNVKEISRNFYLKIQRASWQDKLDSIIKRYRKFLNNATREEIENRQELFSYDFTHNSNKIEGSLLTKRETYNLLRFKVTPADKPESDMIEAKNHHMVFLNMIRTNSKITLKSTLGWHYGIFHYTMPHLAGKIRDRRIVVAGSKASFPHPRFVPALLKQFYRWYDAESTTTANPVELAGLAHFRFVSIHPFGDGNGRISRLLMNNILNSHGYPMLNIRYLDRHSYYTALEKAQTEMDEMIFLKWFIRYYIRQNLKPSFH